MELSITELLDNIMYFSLFAWSNWLASKEATVHAMNLFVRYYHRKEFSNNNTSTSMLQSQL